MTFGIGSTINIFGAIGSTPELLMTYGGVSSGTISNVFDNGISLPAGDLTDTGSSIVVAIESFSGSGMWICATNSWSTSGNWTDGVNNGVPGDGTRGPGVDTAAFSGSGATSITLDISPNIAALSFSGTNYTISGSGTLTLQQGTAGVGTSTVTVASGTQTIASAMEISGEAWPSSSPIPVRWRSPATSRTTTARSR